MKLAEIPTPALVVDIDAMERNIQRMAAFFAEGPCKLRPHFKAHKTPAIARRQLAAGSCVGLTCATVDEAEVVVAEALTDDILIANQVLGPGKAARVAQLAASAGLDIKVAVDSEAGLADIARAAQSQSAEIGVVVEVAIGHRCGARPGEDAVALARKVDATEGVALRGLMGYEGHTVAIAERSEREAAARGALDRLLSTVVLVRAAGLPCEIVSAGATGTYDITGRLEHVNEIQAGSYALMDTDYARLDLPFEHALSVLGTVQSRPRDNYCVADCGHKSNTYDHGNPLVKDIAGAEVVFLSDEHASITIPADSAIGAGDRIELWPSHIDPTINLHDVIYAVRDGEVIEVWPISARGYAHQRAGS
ncbi:MAG: DSD1 family PLP-dependent enzyme [Dehalococcoidia bacterium]